MQQNSYAVIMAGGRGERFWPESRSAHPKQLLRLLSDTTLIEQTVARLKPLFPPENIVIITNQDYVAPMRALLAELPERNIIGEVAPRNTAPCVALAAAYVKSIASVPDPVLTFFPADHAVKDEESFRSVVADCTDFAASSDHIVTIGIVPTFPATGYGYIEMGADLTPAGSETNFNCGVAFREKPDLETAQRYLDAGNFRWNGGMFFMRLNTFCDACKRYAPDIAELYEALYQAWIKDETQIATIFPEARKISIDYAIMERTDKIAVAGSRFDWDDVGAWTSMRNQFPADGNNNIVRSELFAGIDTDDCVIFNHEKDHLVATAGLKDTIVVHTADATLVCSGKSAQRISELVKLLHADPKYKSFI